jgi:two-component system, OmpR family, sensor kinase
VFSKINNSNFVKIAQRWVKEKSSDPDLSGIFVDIFNASGANIASSHSVQTVTYIHQDILRDVAKGRSRIHNLIFLGSPSAKPVLLRSLTAPVIENGRLAYIVQVSGLLTSVHTALSKLRTIFLIFLPVMILLSSLAGLYLADMIMKPLQHIIGTVRTISAENLKKRIDIPDTRDEIKKLADTFNSMLDKLDNSFTSQKQLIQDISHELRTPLTIIRGEIEVALKKERISGDYQAVLKSSLEEIQRISAIVENLLVLSRYDSQEVPLDTKRISVTALLQDIIADVKLLSDRKNQVIELSADGGYPVTADEGQLRRAFLNIIDNAIKYTPAQGRIRVSVEKKPAGVQVRISDSGPGIQKENLPLIFNRFYRVERSRSSEGFGLGLSITESILRAHNATVSVDSEYGKGTTFTVTLPG